MEKQREDIRRWFNREMPKSRKLVRSLITN